MTLNLILLPETFALCRLDPSAPIPGWAWAGPFACLTKTEDELSIVCPQDRVPDGLRCQRSWRCLKVQGPLDFSLTGILASLAEPLAAAGISLFAVSTFDTDYILVKEETLEQAIRTLARAGHEIRTAE